jgi:osmotically-inducible protein OsmY
MSQDHSATTDAALTDALTRFVRHVVGDDVTIRCRGGVVSIVGHVATRTQAEALADLLSWHEGVDRVECDLEIGAGEPASRAVN